MFRRIFVSVYCMYVCMYELCMNVDSNTTDLCYIQKCMYMHVYTVMWLYKCMYVCNELTWQLHVVWDSVWRARYSYLSRSDFEATGSRKPSRRLRMYYQDSNECENHVHIRSGPSGEVLDRTRISWHSLSYRDRP